MQVEFGLIPEQAAAEIRIAYKNLEINEAFLKEAGEGFVYSGPRNPDNSLSALAPAQWPLLAARIEQLLQGSAPRQAELFHLADELGQLLEPTAERYSDLIIAKLTQPLATATPEQDYHRVNINHIEANQTPSIGGETLALHARSGNCNWIRS